MSLPQRIKIQPYQLTLQFNNGCFFGRFSVLARMGCLQCSKSRSPVDM